MKPRAAQQVVERLLSGILDRLLLAGVGQDASRPKAVIPSLRELSAGTRKLYSLGVSFKLIGVLTVILFWRAKFAVYRKWPINSG